MIGHAALPSLMKYAVSESSFMPLSTLASGSATLTPFSVFGLGDDVSGRLRINTGMGTETYGVALVPDEASGRSTVGILRIR